MKVQPQLHKLESSDGTTMFASGPCHRDSEMSDSEFQHEYANVLGINVSWLTGG
jgi:hypothetical protein